MTFNDYLAEWNGGKLRGAQTAFAIALGVKPNTVSQWASNTIPGEEQREKIARHFKITVAELLALYAEPPHEYVSLPIMGILPAGNPDDATASYRGKWEVRRQILKGKVEEHIVVEARGDSMTGLGIHDGDMLTVRLQPDAEDGKVVAAYIEGDGVTCKTLRKKGDRAFLESANPARKAPTGPFKIMGVVVWREGKPW